MMIWFVAKKTFFTAVCSITAAAACCITTIGYITTELSNEELQNKKLYIEVEKHKYEAIILLAPLKNSNFKKV